MTSRSRRASQPVTTISSSWNAGTSITGRSYITSPMGSVGREIGRWRVSSDYAPHKVTSQQNNEQRTCDTEKSSRRSGRLGQSVIAGVIAVSAIAVSAVDVAYGV
jgi:hypothetical protein